MAPACRRQGGSTEGVEKATDEIDPLFEVVKIQSGRVLCVMAVARCRQLVTEEDSTQRAGDQVRLGQAQQKHRLFVPVRRVSSRFLAHVVDTRALGTIWFGRNATAGCSLSAPSVADHTGSEARILVLNLLTANAVDAVQPRKFVILVTLDQLGQV